MTVVSGRGAHVPMLVGVLMEALQVMSLLQEMVRVKALLLVYVLLMMKVMMEEVLLVALSSLSLFTPPPTPTTRPCGACLTQNISRGTPIAWAGVSAQTGEETFPRRDSCFYWRGIQRGPA